MVSSADWMQNPELDGNSFFWQGNSTGFLLIHGFTATTTEVRPLGLFLHQLGFTVSAPLLPGHGTAPQELNQVLWTEWLNCVENAYQQLLETCRVVFVGGESMGALLALLLAKNHSEIVGIMLYAPALKILKLGRARILSHFREYRWKKGGDPSMPWKGYRVVPLKATRQIHLLQSVIMKSLPLINQPTIIFQGKKDKSLDLRGPSILLERLGAKDKTLLWYADSQHCILLDHEFEQVADSGLAFVQRILNDKI
jgi:carboxylesterase